MQTYFVNTQSSGGDGTTNATSGAQAAFASLAAADAALAGDYTAETPATVQVYGFDFTNIAIQIICDMGNPRAVDASAARIASDWILDATHRLLIRAADGTTIGGQATNDSRHKGVFDAGYKIESASNFVGQLQVDTPSANVIVLDLEAEATTTGSSKRGISIGDGIWLINCIGRSQDHVGIEYRDDNRVINCIGVSGGSVGFGDTGGTVTGTRIYNCASPDAGGVGISTDVGEAVVKNCWAFGSVGDDFHSDFAGSSGETNNASEDATAPGANPQTGLVSTAGVDFVDYTNGSYKPADSGKLDGTGADLSADADFAFDFDITGATRAQWDIGPFANVAGAITGSGAPAAQFATVEGAAEVSNLGSGAAEAQTSVVDGTGTVFRSFDIALTGANQLRDINQAPYESLVGIKWEWYDTAGGTDGEPIDKGTVATDESGDATITVIGSALVTGAFGQLLLYHPSDPSIRMSVRMQVP